MAGNPKTRADLVLLSEQGRDKIEELLEAGRPLEDITKVLNVSRKALYRWLDAPEQAGLLTRTRARAADRLAAETLDIADTVAEDQAAIAKAKLRNEARRWVASKWNPQAYGDQKGVNVQINLADLHLTAVRQAADNVLDVTPVRGHDTIDAKPSE